MREKESRFIRLVGYCRHPEFMLLPRESTFSLESYNMVNDTYMGISQ